MKADSARHGYTEADVHFMHRMMAHHAQALVMTGLVPERSRREDLRLLAQRIEVSQQGEIAMMRRWLTDRGEDMPGVEAHGEHHGDPGAAAHHAQHAQMPDMAAMPGMLTQEELGRLRNATGAEFDRLFLQFMIRHHEGALKMVADFFATPGAGQESEIFRFASDVDADQRAEIARLRALQGPP